MVDEKQAQGPFGAFLFPNIFRSFRMAIQPSKLAVAFAAVTAIWLAGRLMDLNPTVVTVENVGVLGCGWFLGTESNGETTELDMFVLSADGLPALLASPPDDSGRIGVFAALRRFTGVQFDAAVRALLSLNPEELVGRVALIAKAVAWAFKHHAIYSIVFFAVVLVILSPAGGAICRLTALQFAQRKRIELRHVWHFSRTRIASFVAAPVSPLIIALLLGLPLVVLGALGNIRIIGEILTGLLLPLGLIVAPFMAVLLIGAVAGLSLLFPAIAYEDSDFFDAISRSFSNVYTKPWRMGFYTLAAAVYGAACYLFVRFFAFLVLWLTRGFLELGLRHEKLQAIWPEPAFDNLLGTAVATPETWSLCLAALLIRIWVLAVAGLVVSFVVSFYFSAGTVVYALMRNRVDGTPLEEIYEAPAATADGLTQADNAELDTPEDNAPEPTSGPSE